MSFFSGFVCGAICAVLLQCSFNDFQRFNAVNAQCKNAHGQTKEIDGVYRCMKVPKEIELPPAAPEAGS